MNNPNMNGFQMPDLSSAYPEIFYRLQPYIMMVCDQLDKYYDNNMPNQEMMDQITENIHNDLIEMYPDLVEYARNYENKEPMQPTLPTPPTPPMQPVQPTKPVQPTPPTQPTKPMQPTQPMQPMQPMQPTKPMQPMQPTKPTQPEVIINNPRIYRRGFRRRGLLRDLVDILFLSEFNRRRRRY